MTNLDTHGPQAGDALADGSEVTDLVDLERRAISARTWHDTEVFELEQDRLFTRTWLFVGHESEVPNPGDFVARHMGLDPVIVARQKDGSIAVMLNSCSHRGGQVCRVDKGNSKDFACPYHGWRYDIGGTLTVVSAEREAFPPDFDKSSHSLPRARVAVYCGLVFACWSDESPELEEYLGDFGFYIQMMLGISPDGWEVIGSPQRWEVKANWKFGAENLSGDGYHVAFVHAAEEEGGRFPPGLLWQAMYGINVADGDHGHGGRLQGAAEGDPVSVDQVQQVLQMMHPWLSPEDAQRVVDSLDPRQIEMMRSGTYPLLGNVFPNFSFVVNPIPGPHGLGTTTFIRTWNPRTPETMEIVNWVIAPKGITEEERKLVAKRSVNTFGSSGTFENDDMEAWTQIQRSTRGSRGKHREFQYHILKEPDASNWREGEDFPGPGLIYQGIATEDNQWHFWKAWRRYMQP